MPNILEDRNFKNKWVSKNNILKQYIGTREGVRYFKKDLDYLVKIRTDQYVDLALIIKWICKDNIIDHVGVCGRYQGMCHIPDFYFAGQFKVMREYFEMLSTKGKANRYLITTSPHTNGIIKYAFEKYFNFINLPLNSYYENGTHENQSIYIFMLNFVFKAIPFDVYEKLEWRGCKLNSEHIESVRRLSTDSPMICLLPIEESAKSLLRQLIKKFFKKVLGLLKKTGRLTKS